MATKEIIHTDILGQPISEGSYVAVSHRNAMYICAVTKISPKMLRVKHVKSKGTDDGWLVYSSETVILSGPDALAYILKYA